MNYAFIGLAILIGLAAALLLFVAYKLVIVPFKEMEGSLSEVESITTKEDLSKAMLGQFPSEPNSPKPIPSKLRSKWLQYCQTQRVIERKSFTEWVWERALLSFPCEGDCGMNYCDENGCVERKRELVPAQEQIGKGVQNAN